MRATYCLLLSFSLLACSSSEAASPPNGTVADTGTSGPADTGTSGPADTGVPSTDTGIAGEAGTEDVTAAVAKFDADAATKICAKLTACCSDADFKSYMNNYTGAPYTVPADKIPPIADCQKTVQAQLKGLHDKWVASIKRGRMSYDPAKAASCLATIDAAACGPILSRAIFDEACFGVRNNEVFEKTAKIGDPCEDLGDSTFYGECDPTLGYCDGPPSKVTDRRCVPWRKQGEDCSAVPLWKFCDTRNGAVCEGGSASVPGKCSRNGKSIPLGGSCGASSGPIDDCVTGSFCDETTMKCVATKKDGDACHWNYECASLYPYSCYPADPLGAGGKCGSKAFCGGK